MSVWFFMRYKSYVMKARQMLCEFNKTKRFDQCRSIGEDLLLHPWQNRVASPLRFSRIRILLFLMQNEHLNDHCSAYDSRDVSIVDRSKFSAKDHVLSGVSSKGDVTPPYSFEKTTASQKKFICMYYERLRNIGWLKCLKEHHRFFSKIVDQFEQAD